jgi:hypothetical protein
MRDFIITLCMLFFVDNLHAQSKPDIVSINNAIEQHLVRTFKPNVDSLANTCKRGCLFVKMSVDTNRTFKSIEISGEAPGFVKMALISAIDSMSSNILLMTRLARLRKTILKPVMYDYQIGCNYPNELTDNKEKMIDFYKQRLSIAYDLDQYSASLRKLLIFDGKEVGYLDCIVLGAMRFSMSSH